MGGRPIPLRLAPPVMSLSFRHNNIAMQPWKRQIFCTDGRLLQSVENKKCSWRNQSTFLVIIAFVHVTETYIEHNVAHAKNGKSVANLL